MRFIAVLLLAVGLAQGQRLQKIPDRMFSAKTIALKVYWPDGRVADINGVRHDAEHFLRKWKRYQIVGDVKDADIAALVIVEPMTVYPNFWQRGAYVWAYSTQYYTAPPPGPSTLLGGSIMIWDAAVLRASSLSDPNGPDPAPLMVLPAEERGSTPLLGAAKRLRKAIDQAEKHH